MSDATMTRAWRSTGGSTTTLAAFMKTIAFFVSIFCFGALSHASDAESPVISIDVSHICVRWASQSNRIYQVQYRSVLTSNLWTNLGFAVQGNGKTVLMTDAVEGPLRFYRVIVPT